MAERESAGSRGRVDLRRAFDAPRSGSQFFNAHHTTWRRHRGGGTSLHGRRVSQPTRTAAASSHESNGPSTDSAQRHRPSRAAATVPQRCTVPDCVLHREPHRLSSLRARDPRLGRAAGQRFPIAVQPGLVAATRVAVGPFHVEAIGVPNRSERRTVPGPCPAASEGRFARRPGQADSCAGSLGRRFAQSLHAGRAQPARRWPAAASPARLHGLPARGST